MSLLSLPAAIADAVRQLAIDHRAGTVTRPDAITRLTTVIRKDKRYAAGILSAHAARLLAAAGREFPMPADPLQAELFPDLPPRLYVAPGKTRNWLGFTRHDWEVARNMLLARTENAVTGATSAARREREDFMRAYDRIVPLLTSPDLTTADVARMLGAA